MKVQSCCQGLFFLTLSAFISLGTSDSVAEGVNTLESMYIEDCQSDNTPHGFYGAFLQPCEFSFFASKTAGNFEQPADVGCLVSNDTRLVARPTPVHWFFNLSEHINKDDWDSVSNDDIPDWDELMLWPDMCVGIVPRCYHVGENEAIKDTLSKLFPNGYPLDATHVRVDCRADALELSRVVYSFASGAAKSLPTIVAWMVTVVLLFLVCMSFCCYGCFRFCNTPLTRKYDTYHVVSAAVVADDDPFRAAKSIEDGLKKYHD